MRDDYKLQGATEKVEVQLEKQVAEALRAMTDHSKFSASELVNTAMKRFISQHKDFMPRTSGKSQD